MSRFRPLAYRRVERALHGLGFNFIRRRGSHMMYRHPDGRMITIPFHADRDVSRTVLRSILRNVNMTFDQVVEKG